MQRLSSRGLHQPSGLFFCGNSSCRFRATWKMPRASTGATRFGILWRIILPLSKPALATLAVFTFMGVFNDFLWALIVVNCEEMRTVQLGLAIFRDRYQTDWGQLMAGSVMATLPILMLFFVAQKYFIQGITLSGLKD